ncbi:MAG: adenosylcobinamide-GDP ribazoletransferase [Lachnospiraceae bacterium]
MNLIRSFFIAFSMYSKIPMPRTDWTKESMRYAMCFFPVIGAVIGGLLYLWIYLTGDSTGSLFRAAVAVLIPIIITGGIHLDGLLDTADALSSYKSMEEKLEILKDSHTGAFAIIVGGAWFILALGTWSEVRLEMMPVLALSFVLSRALSGLAVVIFPKAKNTGLAATFSEMAVKRTVAITMCGFLLLLAHWPFAGSGLRVPMDLAAGLVFFYYYRMSKKKFGGITGDLAGFFLTVSELAMALTVVAVFLIKG